MKTISKTFPIVECNYQPAIDGLNSRCLRRSCTFWRFSRDYFGSEARHQFLVDAAIFAAIALTTMAPLINGAVAVVRLCGAFPVL